MAIAAVAAPIEVGIAGNSWGAVPGPAPLRRRSMRDETGRKADRRFAQTRCWSGRDSNRRSSLWLVALLKNSKFQGTHSLKPMGDLF